MEFKRQALQLSMNILEEKLGTPRCYEQN